MQERGGYLPVAEAGFDWQAGRRYRLELSAYGRELALAVDGQELLRWVDAESPYLHGQLGFGNDAGHRASRDWR